jgi:hypothetical protein
VTVEFTHTSVELADQPVGDAEGEDHCGDGQDFSG